MKCPVCETTQLLMTERSGIEIDYCPQCRGVWLDRGELDKILERSGRDDRPADPPRVGRPESTGFGHSAGNRKDHDRPHRPDGGRKSFWHELFD